MHRMEIYIEENQRNALQDIAYLKTKETKKRVGISELIREAVSQWIKGEVKKLKKLDATDFVLEHPDFLADIMEAKKELAGGRLLTRKELLKNAR